MHIILAIHPQNYLPILQLFIYLSTQLSNQVFI